MKASRTILAAASLISAACLPVSGAAGATAGWRPPLFAPPHVSAWRSIERRAIEKGRRRNIRGYGNEFDQLGAVGPTEGQTPAGEQEEAPQAATFCPPFPAFDRVAVESAGPKIIEIGGHAPALRRAPLPIVVYGDVSR